MQLKVRDLLDFLKDKDPNEDVCLAIYDEDDEFLSKELKENYGMMTMPLDQIAIDDLCGIMLIHVTRSRLIKRFVKSESITRFQLTPAIEDKLFTKYFELNEKEQSITYTGFPTGSERKSYDLSKPELLILDAMQFGFCEEAVERAIEKLKANNEGNNTCDYKKTNTATLRAGCSSKIFIIQ